MAFTGWGKVTIDKDESKISPNQNDFCLVYSLENSFEADSWIHKNQGSFTDSPACIMASGYPAGWCQPSLGFTLAGVEVKCKAMGHDKCVFVCASPTTITNKATSYLTKTKNLDLLTRTHLSFVLKHQDRSSFLNLLFAMQNKKE
eukprot:TRINITY_DN3369_c0_g1_i1.p1 TRINITY_DN3369_c0_g1~~TRINITY_DN3369_c0_g1_i1.p1  ORF type:complete len:145 (-),score=37.69 TRINITY_DN3369_c0_g1_i1:158-592(-)